METKIKYQYTYFIEPFIIKEKSYDKYILNLLKDKRITLKIFNSEKDVGIDTYFNEEIKNIMFKTLNESQEQIKNLENIREEEYQKIINMPCICFEYKINQNAQAKMGEESGIFFKIDKIEIMCFKPGICFLSIKTYLDENITFNDVLNFNYKFKTLNTKNDDLRLHEKIHIQSNEFKDKTDLITLMQELTANNLKPEEFYTFTYVCIDGEEWNEKKEFSRIQKDFNKLTFVMPASKNIENEISHVENLEYIKIGIDKNSTALITNSLETYNYTKLPFEYENEYRYTLIYALYQKIALKEFGEKLRKENKYKQIKKKLTNFINNSWAKEITKNTIGSKLYKTWREELELENIYLEIANKYEMAYKDERIKKNQRNNKIIWSILAICLIINIINVIILINLGK